MNTPNYLKAIALFVAFIPNISFGQLSAETTADFSDPDTTSVEPSSSKGKEYNAKVLEVKKMTRYSLGFVVDLPSINAVLTYMSDDLGVDISNVEQLNDPTWDPEAFSTSNFKVTKDEYGDYEVVVRYYPPSNPMEVENVADIQRSSREQCSEAIEQLKQDQVK